MNRDLAKIKASYKRPGKARSCAFSPVRGGSRSDGSSVAAKAAEVEVHVAFGLDDGSIEIWDGGLRRFVERINSNKRVTNYDSTVGAERNRMFAKGKHYPKEWIQDIKYSQNGNFLAVVRLARASQDMSFDLSTSTLVA